MGLREVRSDYSNPVWPDLEWVKGELGRTLCSKCRKIDRSRYPQAIDAHLRNLPEGQACAGLWRTGLRVFHKSLIRHLQPFLEEFVVGRCFHNGQLIQDYATLYGSNYVVVRGDALTKYYICEQCGTIGSTPGPTSSYVLRRQLSRASVYQNSGCSLLLTEDLVQRTDWSLWPDVYLLEVDIRDEPIDGQQLPGD